MKATEIKWPSDSIPAPAIKNTVIFSAEFAGVYQGILASSSGYHWGNISSLNIRKDGSFSGRLQLFGDKVSMRGKFNQEGVYETSDPRSGSTYTMRFAANEDNITLLTGSMDFPGLIDATFQLKKVTAAQAKMGNYTAMVHNASDDEFFSFRMRVRADGVITVLATVANGVAATSSSRLCEGDGFHLFISPRKTAIRGIQQMIGVSYQFRDVAQTSDFDGMGDISYMGTSGFSSAPLRSIGCKFIEQKGVNPLTLAPNDEQISVYIKKSAVDEGSPLIATWTKKNKILSREIAGQYDSKTGYCTMKMNQVFGGPYNFKGVFFQKQAVVVGEGFNSKIWRTVSVEIRKD
jgi:hypothetical protein